MSNRPAVTTLTVLLGFTGIMFADAPPVVKEHADDGNERYYLAGATCVGAAIVLEVLLKVAVIWYILRDSRERGMDPTIWIIIAVFAEVVGLIVYLCVRPPLRKSTGGSVSFGVALIAIGGARSEAKATPNRGSKRRLPSTSGSELYRRRSRFGLRLAPPEFS